MKETASSEKTSSKADSSKVAGDFMKVPFFKPDLGKEEENAVLRVMRSGWLTTGQETLAFEKEFAAYTGAKHALAVNSNTSGLILSMEACGIKAGSKILTTPYTFASTAISALHAGGSVVWADIEKDSYSISPEKIEEKLKADSSIKAVVPVHIAGNLCDMEKINAIAAKYNVKVIEDAAHSFPSKTEKGFAGTLGDAGVFSFYATKTITTGEGGMVLTDDDALAARMKTMRLHGINRDVWDRYTSSKASWEYDIIAPGYKFNLPDILAAIGREQLKKAQALFEKRSAIAKIYNKAFSEYDFIKLPPDGRGNAWHLYLMRIVPEKLSVTRNELSNLLQEKGLGISMHFIPHFHMTYFKNTFGLKAEDFPNAEQQFQTTLTLPFFPGMTEEQAAYVVKTVVSVCKEHYRK